MQHDWHFLQAVKMFFSIYFAQKSSAQLKLPTPDVQENLFAIVFFRNTALDKRCNVSDKAGDTQHELVAEMSFSL